MFAKKASFKPFAAIKGSERKSVLSRIQSDFGLQDPDAELKSALVPKTVQAARCVLHSGAKAQVYSQDGKALWVVVKDKLMPTVITLQKAPHLVPVVYTVPNTLQFLQNGADFMVPGIFGDLPEDAHKGSVVQIRSLDEDVLAVGVALVDLSKPDTDKGKAVEVVNVIGDTLTPLSAIPPRATEPREEERKETPVENAQKEFETKSATETLASLDISTDEADDAFATALDKVLRVPHEFPMPSAKFATLLTENLPYLPDELSFKNTSWKKLSKFLKSAEKESKLKLKERQGELVIQSAVLLDGPPPDNHDEGRPKKTRNKAAKMEAIQLYKARSTATDVVPAKDLARYLTGSDLRTLVQDYISSNKLAEGPEVKVNAGLRKALGLKQDVTAVRRDEVLGLFLKHCSLFHAITHPGDDEPAKVKKGAIPKISLNTERRGGNKIVTKVSGVEAFGFDAKAVADQLRVKCAGSATVMESRTGPQIQVQGDHVRTISRILEQKGVRSSWIQS